MQGSVGWRTKRVEGWRGTDGIRGSLLHTAQVSAPRGEGSEGPRRVRRVQSLPSSLSDGEVVLINIYLSNRDLEQALLLKQQCVASRRPSIRLVKDKFILRNIAKYSL